MPAAASRAGELPAVYRMWVHTFDFSEAELVLSAPLLEKLRLSPGDLVEITPESDDGGAAQLAVPRPVSPQTAEPPSPMPVAIGGGIPDLADTAEPLVLRVSSPPPAAKSAMQLSVLKSVADAFGLGQRQTVCVRQVAPASVAVDWAELAFKDQHLGRGDIWHCRQQLVQEATALHVGKTFVRSGAKMQVLSMARRGGAVRSGVILERSRLTFRSRSAAFILLVQVSPEMWTPTPTGDVCYERALAFLSSLFERWASLGVSHSLTVVRFARCFADDAAPASAQPRAADADASAGPDGPPTAACAVSAQSAASATSVADASAAGSAAAGVREAPLMRDVAGRQYTDYYKTVVESESRADWHSLLAPLRREILAFRSSLTRREPATSTLPGGAPAVPLRARPGRLSAAAQGNLLEAINLSLDVLEGPAATAPAARALAPPSAWRTGSYEEADLASSGKSIIVVTGGSGWFEVDEGLTQMTKQRMVDNGIGCDLVCATCPPLHTTPLFTFVHETAPGAAAKPRRLRARPSRPVPAARARLAPRVGPSALVHLLPRAALDPHVLHRRATAAPAPAVPPHAAATAPGGVTAHRARRASARVPARPRRGPGRLRRERVRRVRRRVRRLAPPCVRHRRRDLARRHVRHAQHFGLRLDPAVRLGALRQAGRRARGRVREPLRRERERGRACGRRRARGAVAVRLRRARVRVVAAAAAQPHGVRDGRRGPVGLDRRLWRRALRHVDARLVAAGHHLRVHAGMRADVRRRRRRAAVCGGRAVAHPLSAVHAEHRAPAAPTRAAVFLGRAAAARRPGRLLALPVDRSPPALPVGRGARRRHARRDCARLDESILAARARRRRRRRAVHTRR